jgi:hypothetical protein
LDVFLETLNAARQPDQLGHHEARTPAGQQSQRPIAPAGKTQAENRANQSQERTHE